MASGGDRDVIQVDRLTDAARVAAKAGFPTDIHLDPRGFRVVTQKGGRQVARYVTFDEVEFANINPLVEAVRELNAGLRRSA
jgi:hypothetical protein